MIIGTNRRMERVKHAPQPWKIVIKHGHYYGLRNDDGFICHFIKPYQYTDQVERYEREAAEQRATAHLIAAAPDLLEACKQVVASYPYEDTYDGGKICDCPTCKAYRRCKTAIAKAGGSDE